MLTQLDTFAAESKKLDESYAYCRDICRKNSNFYLGILVTTAKEKRKALFSIYAWLHAVDAIADDKNITAEEKSINLQRFYHKTQVMLSQTSDSHSIPCEEKYWLAFCRTVRKYHIPASCLEGMILGQQQDLVKNHYQNFPDLYEYCRLVASQVGLMCITIWGYQKDSDAEQLAEHCGIAFQLTNILRDMLEDVKLNRVYLPAEFVGVDNLTAINFKQIAEKNLMSGILKLIAKAEDYYNQCSKLHKYIHSDGKFSFLMMIESYGAIFKEIQKDPRQILIGQKIKINNIGKIRILFLALMTYLGFRTHKTSNKLSRFEFNTRLQGE